MGSIHKFRNLFMKKLLLAPIACESTYSNSLQYMILVHIAKSMV